MHHTEPDGIISPHNNARNVILNARRESDPGRNTELKLKSTFGKPYALTLNEQIDEALNKPKFGIDLYKPRNLTLN